jgi:hypothetical protein
MQASKVMEQTVQDAPDQQVSLTDPDARSTVPRNQWPRPATIPVPLLIGSIPGIAAGSLLASRVPEFVLRPTLAIALAIVGIRLLG